MFLAILSFNILNRAIKNSIYIWCSTSASYLNMFLFPKKNHNASKLQIQQKHRLTKYEARVNRTKLKNP